MLSQGIVTSPLGLPSVTFSRAHTVATVVEEATGQNGGRAPGPELPGDGVGAFLSQVGIGHEQPIGIRPWKCLRTGSRSMRRRSFSRRRRPFPAARSAPAGGIAAWVFERRVDLAFYPQNHSSQMYSSHRISQSILWAASLDKSQRSTNDRVRAAADMRKCCATAEIHKNGHGYFLQYSEANVYFK